MVIYILSNICLHLLASVNNVAVNICVQISLQEPAFSSLGYIPRSGIAGSYSSFILNFRGTVFYTVCTILHFPQQCTRVPVSPHPHQYLLFTVFCFVLIEAILPDVKW